MKIHIEVVTGFLGAGKTSFINSLLTESHVEGEKVLIFQLENGEKRITSDNKLIRVQEVNGLMNLKKDMICFIKKFNPNRIIIEYNGTSSLEELFDILNEKEYKESSKITTIFFIADGRSLKKYIDNVGIFIIPFIQYANMIILNNVDFCNKEELNKSFKQIRNINPKAYILKVNNRYILNSTLKETKVLDNGYLKKFRIRIANIRK